MTIAFWARSDPDDGLLEALGSLEPANPFLTRAFVRYRVGAQPGIRPWAVGLEKDGVVITGCIGYLQSSRMPWSDMFEIHSLCPLPEGSGTFWSGIREFCGKQRIKSLTVQTFGSRPVALPTHESRLWHRQRCEYAISLPEFPGLPALSSNHRRNVNRAARDGVRIEEPTDESAAMTHAALMGLSMDRRKRRGESVASGDAADTITRLIHAGAGRIYQAVQHDEALSSILLLHAREGAYYHSAGTSPEGMKAGASHYLVCQLAFRLQEMGLSLFNLGGADSEGLARFKRGFGAQPVELEAAGYYTGGRMARMADAVIGPLRRLRT